MTADSSQKISCFLPGHSASVQFASAVRYACSPTMTSASHTLTASDSQKDMNFAFVSASDILMKHLKPSLAIWEKSLLLNKKLEKLPVFAGF